MGIGRRAFLGAGAALGVAGALGSGRAVASTGAQAKILEPFAGLPGEPSVLIVTAGGERIARDPDRRLAVGSAVKVFILAEFLRMVESGEASLDELLPLDESVYSFGSSAFGPQLRGKVRADIACQEMIAYSDNTATDMLLHRITAARVREFVKSIGLSTVGIPDSTRAFASYLAGMPPGEVMTWKDINAPESMKSGTPRPIVNDVQPMTGSAADFVSFYGRALKGEFFKQPDTLARFRWYMNDGYLIQLSAPHGAAVFTKGGSLSLNGWHALTVAGAMETLDKTILYCLTSNWQDAKDENASNTRAPLFFTALKSALAQARALDFP